MAELIKPKDLNPEFLKKIEDAYGKVDMEYDYFDSNLTTYYKTDPSYKSEGGGKKRDIINLPTLNKLFSDLGKARNTAKNLKTKKALRNDTEFQSQADDVMDTFNSFRTFFRKNYPDQYAMAKKTIKEISTSGAAGGYLTKYAYKKKGSPAPESQYIKMGYKPVNTQALRKKSKGFDYIDLYKD